MAVNEMDTARACAVIQLVVGHADRAVVCHMDLGQKRLQVIGVGVVHAYWWRPTRTAIPRVRQQNLRFAGEATVHPHCVGKSRGTVYGELGNVLATANGYPCRWHYRWCQHKPRDNCSGAPGRALVERTDDCDTVALAEVPGAANVLVFNQIETVDEHTARDAAHGRLSWRNNGLIAQCLVALP